MPATNLKRVQFGKEIAWGTPVAATALLMGVTESELKAVDEIYHVKEQGSMGPSPLVAEIKIGGEGSIGYDLTYEDICFMLDGMHGACSPSGANPYTWAYAAPLASAPTPRPFTLEYGAPSANYKCEGALIHKLTIKGEVDKGGVWGAKLSVLGQAVTTVTMASLSARVCELIRMVDTVLYIDTWVGTMGATAVASSLVSFTLDVDAKHHLKRFAGALPAADYGTDQWEGKLSLTVEYNATVKAIVDAMLAPALTQRQIQIKATSSAKSATIQFAGTLAGGAKLFEDRDGNMLVTLVFEGTYCSGAFANWLKWSIVNAVASLP